jgi:hypothetical protein
MAVTTPPPVLVKTPCAPRAVAHARGVRAPEAFLRGGETALAGSGAWPASLVVDFGEELAGTFEFDGWAEGEVRMEVFYGEDLAEALVTKDPFPADNWYKLPRDAHALATGEHTVRHPGRRAGRYVNIVSHGPGKFVLRACRATREHAPVEERGWFNCSDPLLNEAWQISRRTIKLCMQQHYEDGVKRDGMLWIGDYRVEFLCGNYLFGDAALGRRGLEMFADCQRPNGALSAAALRAGGHQQERIGYIAPGITEPNGLDRWVLDNYCADYVCALEEYVLHTGDALPVKELAPQWRTLLGYLEKVDIAQAKSPENFLTDNRVEESNWWGSRSTLAYQLAAAFAAGARLLESLGEVALAGDYRGLHGARLRQAAADFGDPREGKLCDDYGADATMSWHSYAAAWQAGAISAEQWRTLHPALAANPRVRGAMAGFMEYWLLASWFGAGRVQEALDEMRSYWGQMLRNGATTTWELVDRRVCGLDKIVAGGRSHCHGWSAGPAHVLPAFVAGVRPTAPGFSEVEIRPMLGGLEWAEAEVPTPHGVIRVAWDAAGAGEVTLPDGVTATVHRAGREPLMVAPGASVRVD